MEKKLYIVPAVDIMTVSSVLMQKTDVASLLPGPGYNPAPRRHDDEVPVF